MLLLVGASSAWAQLPNDDYRGVAATGLELRKLGTTKRLLLIAAHPDDEDTQLLSVLALAQGADVAYLSLNRGEGGQNSIGPELGVGLGLLRTSELLAARKLDRAQQFFTRALDYGFSKNSDEAFRHWPRDSILADVVSVLRRFRPDVVVSTFTGTPRDGHGQHQAAGILAREAFVAAADPGRFAEQIRAGLRPHRVSKLYQSANFRGEPTLRLRTGDRDPLIGRSYAQVAGASRSRHRSQDFGVPQPPGPRTTAVQFLESHVNTLADDVSLFSGVDTTLSARAVRAREAAAVQRALREYDTLAVRARRELTAYESAGTAALLVEAHRKLGAISAQIANVDLRFAAEQELADAGSALRHAAGVTVDPVSSVEAIVPGQTFDLDVTIWNGGASRIDLARVEPLLPTGWQQQRVDTTTARSLGPNEMVTRTFRITVPLDAEITQPYYLAEPRPGDYYAWPSEAQHAGLPFEPAPVRAIAHFNVAGTRVDVMTDATRRVIDRRQGELRRRVHVAPAFTLRPEPATAVVPLGTLTSGSRRGIETSVEVVSHGDSGSVVVMPVLPAGWRSAPERVSVAFAQRGETRTVAFTIQPTSSAAVGLYTVRFAARDAAGREYALTQRLVDYSHIDNRAYYEPSVMNVSILDARFARGMRVGYVVGVDADVPRALEQLGVLVERLDEGGFTSPDLGRFDAIVVGSRAYEVRGDLVAHNARLLDYARKGGNLVVLYQQYDFIAGNFAPYALTIARPHDRITDENAPVRLLDANAAALRTPNRIAGRDFEGWLQERSLYMPRTWAPEYKPVLEMNDPGEEPQQGAVLTARLGEGHYTYTGLAFFRQIPAGVPGALRLFINLLSLGIKDGAL